MVLSAFSLLITLPIQGFSPQGESVLGILRERIAAGAAGEEAYASMVDLLSEGDADDCEAWSALPELRADEARFADIRAALQEACPDWPWDGEVTGVERGQSLEGEAGGGAPDGARSGRFGARGSASRTVRPRRDSSAAEGDLALRGEGYWRETAWRSGAWKLGFRGDRPEQRYLRIGSGRFAVHAGHLHSALARTRLGFVAGSRFYAGRTGTSGATGLLFSPQSALDGAGVSLRAGHWLAEAAGTWNRLNPLGHAADSTPPDALLYQFGLAHGGGGDGQSNGMGFRFQAAHLRCEPPASAARNATAAYSAPEPAGSAITLAGVGLQGAEGPARWRMGLAGSLPYAPVSSGVPPDWLDPGGYAEVAFSTSGPQAWLLEARQASPAWANPLQAPRGILRDTLAGAWILPGRGEGGVASRARFPVAAYGAWSAAMQGTIGADWSLARGPLTESGNFGISQARGPWTHEAGASLAWRALGISAGSGLPTAYGTGTTALGWGQTLAWSRGPWWARSAFTWVGGAYQGSRPAPLSVEVGRGAATSLGHGATGLLESGAAGLFEPRAATPDDSRESGASAWCGSEWTAGLLTGDIRKPWRYLRADLRQEWAVGRKVRVQQEIRLPWNPEGLAADMGYQLRLEGEL